MQILIIKQKSKKKKKKKKDLKAEQVPGPHACNLSYLGGSYQEDHSLKPAWANSS
jgi:hypothetical protein